jgi:capsid protein
MTRDTTGQTFAGGRLSQQMDYQAFRPFQEFVARKFCSPIYRRWLQTAILDGVIIAPGYWKTPSFWQRHQWLQPSWSKGINPTQDVSASISSMEAGLTTLADECGFAGRDWKEQLRIARKIKAVADQYGLTLRGTNQAAAEIKAAAPNPESEPLQIEE